MGLLAPFLWGMATGAAGGFLTGLFTADEESPRQQRIREIVRYMWEEAKRAADEQERILLSEYSRLTGIEGEE